jgi:hypothetical protein
MDHMEGLGLSKLALDYKDLSIKVMEHELNRYVRHAEAFRALPQDASTPVPIPMPMPMPTSNSLAFPDTDLMDVDSQDEGEFLAADTDESADLVLEFDEDGYLVSS